MAPRASAVLNVAVEVLAADGIGDWAKLHGVERIVTPYAPAGLAGWTLAELSPQLAERGIALHPMIRPLVRAVWRHATRCWV